MKLRDFVVNSLPRVRSKKKTRGNPPQVEVVTSTSKGRNDPPRSSIPLSSLSRESSIDRASHVAVADVKWRPTPPELRDQEDTEMLGSLPYYPPPPPTGMVMSHSAEGISTHNSLAIIGPVLDYSIPACSENALNYAMPAGVVFQSQHHHHRHNHQHDYHYYYHHHHHHQYPPVESPYSSSARAPLTDSNHFQRNPNLCKATAVSQNKSEPGFLRKSFASFKAMRKQRSKAKDSATAKIKSGDENAKCYVCPYPQLQAMGIESKKPVDLRPVKPKRKGLKSLRKSNPSKGEQLDKSWFSDNEANNHYNHSDAEIYYYTTTPRPRFRECSVESCMSRLNGSQDGGCYGTADADACGFDSQSLSGYESDLPRGKAGGRTRSRIKTNPWLPSPQPSLNIGRRFERSDFRESREDVMTVDDDPPSMPRSASFDYHRPSILPAFQSSSSKGRPIQRHRSLTPSDLKITLGLNKNPTSTLDAQPLSSDSSNSQKHIRNDKDSINDLSQPIPPKSRPTSMLSPSSEFLILTDNIEQLANNISFEYEEMLDTTLETVPTYPEDGKISIQELLTDEELTGHGKGNCVVFSNSNQINNNAHSPDSGIGGLGSSDGDESALAAAASASGQSPLPPSSVYSESSPSSNGQAISARETPKTNGTATGRDGNPTSLALSPHSWSTSNNVQHHFPSNPNVVSAVMSSSIAGLMSTCPNPSTRCSSADFAHNPANIDEIVSTKAITSCSMNLEEEEGGGEDDNVNFSSVNNTQIMNRYHNSVSETRNDSLTNLFSGSSCCNTNDTNIRIQLFPPSHTLREDSDSSYTNLNNFEETCYRNNFSESQLSTGHEKTHQLPPNIIRSEQPTPVESPIDNWQFEVSFMPDDAATQQKDEGQYEKVDETGKGSSYQSNHLHDHESLTPLLQQEMSESATSQTDDATDWVDASVQTDFNEEDFDFWQANSSSKALDDLREEQFDAIESTRRWLLTGNMQGSADTGYSSQPRDSQILMDDDDSVAGSDNQNQKDNKKTMLSRPRSAQTAEELQGSKSSNSESHRRDGAEVYPDKQKVLLAEECRLPKLANSKEKYQTSDKLVHNMFSGIESQFKDIFHLLWPAENISEKSANKRDSSGSSTSTLISEPLVSVETTYSSKFSDELNELDDRTPEKSISEQNNSVVAKQDVSGTAQSLRNNTSKKKKTTEPDYVNVPRKGKLSKSDVHKKALCDHKCKDHSGNIKMCNVRSHSFSTTCSNLRSPEAKSWNFSPLWRNQAAMAPTERADYLEFLKDAPLRNPSIDRPVFLIPGFGPIDMSSANLEYTDWPSRKSTMKSDSVRLRPKQTDSITVHQVQALISEGRAGTRSKRSQEKSSPDLGLNCSGSTKSHETYRDRSVTDHKAIPDKPKRKNPRTVQQKPCPVQTHAMSSSCPMSDQMQDAVSCRPSCKSSQNSVLPNHHSSYTDNSSQSLAKRVWQLQQEKDLIYLQLREVQQEELSRQRQQLQHQRNVHSQRKEILLETLRELKTNLEEQSRKLNLACNKDVYI